MSQSELNLQIFDSWMDGETVRFFDLRDSLRGPLPSFDAGSHVNVVLPNGLERQYSLSNSPAESHRYVLGVALDANSRGGSRYLHESASIGNFLSVSLPRSHFPLHETATHTVLLAGGIGITPIWAMAQRLAELGLSWELHYGVRNTRSAALTKSITLLGQKAQRQVRIYFQDENNEMMDFETIFATAPEGSHFYCCGPAPMLGSYRTAAASISANNIHFEQFTPAAPAATNGGYTIELAKSGRKLTVEPGKTILDTLLANGIRVNYSCREGVCGECETAVLSGKPDHRDAILTEAEKATGKTMMICCSGALSDHLILDR